MERRMRQNWDKHTQEPPRKRSQYKKPTWGWQPAVPSWEKQFCKAIGSLEWEIFVRRKKFVHLYDNVINWDDSEAKEAFQNAKTRFWSEMCGIPCDIQFPDPDLYIDVIDWDSEKDFQLPCDLINPGFFDSDEKCEPVVIFGDSFFVNQAFLPGGWGDYEENVKMSTHSACADAYPVGWMGESGFCSNSWELSVGCGCPQYASWGWNYFYDPYDYRDEHGNVNERRVNGVRGVWDGSIVDAGSYVWWNSGEQCEFCEGEMLNADKRRDLGWCNAMNSCQPVTQQVAIAVGRMWN